MTQPRTRAASLLALVLSVVIVAGWAVTRYAEGLAFVVHAANLHGNVRWLADHYRSRRVTERPIDLPLTRGTIRARVYWPGQPPRRTVLLVSGLHVAGIDEPRLILLARSLAERGIAVVTPDIPELRGFAITPAITDAIEQSALRVAADDTLARDHRVGLMGISFSGGLAIVAAGRPSLSGRLAYVFAFGAHGDLPRVLRYLCTGVSGTTVRPPHDYGLAVVAFTAAERLVPPEQVEMFRAGVHRFLFASHQDRDDKPGAEREIASLRALAGAMPLPAGDLLRLVVERNVSALGPRLLPLIGDIGRDAALSPEHSAKPTVPVFLLHGADDNVIPPEESASLATALAGKAPVELLVSDLVSHAEADQAPTFASVLRLAAFWGHILVR